MSSLSRNSCAKAFGNWSRGKNFSLKKPRGVNEPPPPTNLRAKIVSGNYTLHRLMYNQCLLNERMILVIIVLHCIGGGVARLVHNFSLKYPSLK